MPASLLTINTMIPAIERPGTPMIVAYDNGDWELAFLGDVDYIVEGSSNFHSAQSFIEFFIGLMIYFDMGDADDLDVSGDVVYLAISETIITGQYDEPVLLIYQDGEMDVMAREEAENIIHIDPDVGMNFISALELFEDFRTFRSRHEDVMFADDEERADEDEDADKEDI